MYAIEARKLNKAFGGYQAVAGLDVLVEEGEVVALLGPNGAGKTTTLMMLLGITEPDSGEVRLLGHRLPEERTAALGQTNFTAAYIGLPNRMKVKEILEIFAGLYGVGRGRVGEVADLFGITHLLGKFTTHLSSGQKTLVGLAKALLNHPRLLILDEPTASLDPHIAAMVRRVIKKGQEEEGFSLLITSHNMFDVERLCRRVIFIADGRVVADGSPKEIAARFGAEDLEGTFLTIAGGGGR